ncbi:HAD hydrolase-like protein [Amycolatopsis sp. PS_44_ISF1]|uniref:HAD hydrolase-like protein n=1 Tax=Amycolatopsis sp. PS_44_ISF1 TaxID=2974917 RepID=UPI0028E01B13|nr:HAD hydrolase-like protein [Amycolatopsis sp. PS_44_ISF1]MDT8912550.1 HAD hydrolase-like protein [Amycolatopsis sp. PS_44_ISF1]
MGSSDGPDDEAGVRRTVLFDLDGTLADSAALITEHLALAITKIGGPRPAPEVLRTLVGPPLDTGLLAIGLSADQTRAARLAYDATYNPIAPTHTPVYPGIRELLARLRDAGMQLAVATSKPEPLAVRVAAGLGFSEFLTVVGGADEANGRGTKADVVASVLERLGLDPAHAPVVMVGDRHHDVDGAAAHGVPAIGVGWGYARPGELTGAVAVVPDVAALETVLLGPWAWAGNREASDRRGPGH